MRAMPVVLNYVTKYSIDLGISILRALLVSGAASGIPPVQLTKSGFRGMLQLSASAAGKAANRAEAAANSASAFTYTDIIAVRYDAAFAVFDAARSVTGSGLDDTTWNALNTDCRLLANEEYLFAQPLWSTPSSDVDKDWKSVRISMQQKGWQFWINWYERALAGEPQPWPLLLEIAIQEDDFWQGSDDEVMARINEIVERYEDPSLAQLRSLISQQGATNLGSEEELATRNRVLRQIEELLRSLPPAADARAGIGHNQPPDEFALDEEQISRVRTNADALQREAASSEPNFEVVVEKAFNFSGIIGWAARKIELTVTEFCKSFGSTLGKATGVMVPAALLSRSYWGEIVNLFQATKAWLSVVVGGI